MFERFSQATLESIARNINATWTQSGHLIGRVKKIRSTVQPGPGAVSYALLMGYLSGFRGESLFHTEYSKIFDLCGPLYDPHRSKKFRKAIAAKRLLLISPYHPEAPFRAWAAMGRNKLIYAMADFALVVSSEHKKGGTWAGVTEELRREFYNQQPDLFVEKQKQNNATLFDQSVESNPSVKKVDDKVKTRVLNIEAPRNQTEPQKEKILSTPSIYDVVLPVILEKLSSPASAENLAGILDIQKSQLNIWLKKAIEEKKVKKMTKPVRYVRLEK